MSQQVENLVKSYRALASIPALIGAKLVANNSAVTSVWSQRNIERTKTSRFTQTLLLTPDLKKACEIPPTDISNELLSSTSPSERYRAVLREVEAKDGRKQFLEVWDRKSLARCVDLAGAEVHGDVYTDGEFGVLRWSPDESKLLYVAERKVTKSEPFYKRKGAKKEADPPKPVGEEYLFRQDWGEDLVGKIQPILALYNVTDDAVSLIEGVPEDLCPAQPAWGPDGSYIVGIAFVTQPRKLGLVYCTNRTSRVFVLDLVNKNYVEISGEGKSVKAPRFSPDGKTLVWLERGDFGPHHTCMTLVKKDVPLNSSPSAQIVVSVVKSESRTSNGTKFYGLYNTSFVTRCWASERRLLLSTNQRNTINSYVIDIDTGIVTELESNSDGSQVVLDVYNDIVLVNRRSLLTPDRLALGILPAKGEESTIKFHDLTETSVVERLEGVTYEYLHLAAQNGQGFSATYIGPKSGSDTKVPLVLWPHGGPHSAFANNLALETSLFASNGFAVLQVNYRGSIGAGEDSVNSLLGKVGQADVSDCMAALRAALEKFPWIDPDRVALVGGSHGGFLVAHLSGQHPDAFKAVVARNPVIDLASMSTISDIPDWCYAESGEKYTQKGQVSEELLLAMRKASPIQHAHKVRAPTLLQIGSKDLRVPPSQATDFYHRLKANGTKVRMNLYDDNHPLGSVPNEMDNLINTLLWIKEHTA